MNQDTPVTNVEVPPHLMTMFNELHSQIQATQGQLQAAQTQIGQLNVAQTQHTGMNTVTNYAAPKPQKPPAFNGKGSVDSWATHMDQYVASLDGTSALALAVTYISGDAHEWWLAHCKTVHPTPTQWEELRNAILIRYNPLNKVKIARDKLSRWRQMKDVEIFSRDFLKLVLEIPYISMDEQIDRYSRALKPYIWKELCTKEYTDLSQLMKDAERVEAAHRGGMRNSKYYHQSTNEPPGSGASNGPVPMELGNVRLSKLTREEREKCLKDGLCLRCRQPGHFAKTCPKNQLRN